MDQWTVVFHIESEANLSIIVQSIIITEKCGPWPAGPFISAFLLTIRVHLPVFVLRRILHLCKFTFYNILCCSKPFPLSVFQNFFYGFSIRSKLETIHIVGCWILQNQSRQRRRGLLNGREKGYSNVKYP